MRTTAKPEVSRNIAQIIGLIIFLLNPISVHAQAQPRPCQKLITYRIAGIDERFHLSSSELAAMARQAAAAWNQAMGRELLREDPHSTVAIRMIYDYRQTAADKLKRRYGTIEDTEASYKSLQSRFTSLKTEYEALKTPFDQDVAEFNSRLKAFQEKYDAAHKQLWMSEEGARRLNAERDELIARENELKARQDALSASADTLKSLVVVINEIAANLNLAVVHYNQAGEPLQQEFKEGTFQNQNGRQSIMIYYFTDKQQLICVLAHEFGHTLGLEHNKNPHTRMYRLNQTTAAVLAPEDIAQLKARCGGK